MLSVRLRKKLKKDFSHFPFCYFIRLNSLAHETEEKKYHRSEGVSSSKWNKNGINERAAKVEKSWCNCLWLATTNFSSVRPRLLWLNVLLNELKKITSSVNLKQIKGAVKNEAWKAAIRKEATTLFLFLAPPTVNYRIPKWEKQERKKYEENQINYRQ